jgi:hypothetical protein
MKLITENIFDNLKPVITEETGAGKSYFIEGPFLQADIKNRNGRVYPMKTLRKEVARYMKELVAENRAVGELGHPDSPTINLERISHLITDLHEDGTNFYGRAKILSTTFGEQVKRMLDDGVKLGVSSRGVGSLVQRGGTNIVGEDFYLATAADIVADPSAPEAFVRGIMEGKEWVWNNGILKEADAATLKKQVVAAHRQRPAFRQVPLAEAYTRFLKALRVTVE